MSDGMSDSRPYSTDREQWAEVEGVKLRKPIDVWFYHFRDGIQAECILLDIAFFVSRWGGVRIEGAASDGGDAIAFVDQDSEQIARAQMKKLMAKRLGQARYRKWLAEEGY